MQCVLKVSVRELAPMIHSRHAHACGAYHLGQVQVRQFGQVLVVALDILRFLNLIFQMLIVAGGYHVGHKLKSTEVVDC